MNDDTHDLAPVGQDAFAERESARDGEEDREGPLVRDIFGAPMWRVGQAREVAAQLLRPNPPLVCITAKPGAGRTSLLDEVEQVLARTDDAPRLSRFRPTSDPASEDLQRDLDYLASTDGYRAGEVIVIDDLHTTARLGTRGPDAVMLEQIALAHQREHVRFLLTIDEGQLERLADVAPEVAASLHHIRLPDLPATTVRRIVTLAARRLASAAGVHLVDGVADEALAPAQPGEGRVHPGLAMDRIDQAIGRARLHGYAAVTAAHLHVDPDRAVAVVAQAAPVTAAVLGERLREGVHGQDSVIDTLAGHLAPALAGLKLRPERPHGVFLFAGPSGVGKTELARRTAEVVYGDSGALIRLDMSEYANEQDARVKLIGAHRSWKNSSTEGLLTTRVIENPRTVVLLDEFEKSAPQLWSIFLQIFDEGRLTDGWSQAASFGETIIILTSNLGVREGATRPAGFGADSGFSSEKQLGAIARALPPELMNRLTAVIPFRPLTPGTIRELAELELTRAANRFAEGGWRIQWTPEVVDWLAGRGYDPAYGARHLQRAIAQGVLPLLAASPRRAVRLEVHSGALQTTEGPP